MNAWQVFRGDANGDHHYRTLNSEAACRDLVKRLNAESPLSVLYWAEFGEVPWDQQQRKQLERRRRAKRIQLDKEKAQRAAASAERRRRIAAGELLVLV